MISQILASARETFAGVSDSSRLFIGPAAIGPAAAAEGTVAAAASSRSALGNCRPTCSRNVHRGEMIVPAARPMGAERWLARRQAAEGGVTVDHATHFDVSALDRRMRPLFKTIAR